MTIRILGTDDTRSECGLCGKKGLKRVVWLEIDGDVVAYGTDCAGMTLYGRKSAHNTETTLRAARCAQAAQDLLASGMKPQNVVNQLFNKFGYGTGVENGMLVIHAAPIIKIPLMQEGN